MSGLPTLRRFLVVVVALGTLAASCGDSEEPAGAPGTDPGQEDSVVDTAPMPSVELTASFRGVTETTISVGVVAPDLDSVRQFVDLDHGSYEAAYRALIADVNANGGVLGREIEMVFDQYLPIGTEAMDTICARMTQDEQVFAVLGGLQDDGPLCYTALSDTAFVGSVQNDRRIAESSAPWFTGMRNSDDEVDVILRGFDREGVFADATVAVVAAIADEAEVEDIAVPLLSDLGVDVVDVSFIEASPIDTVAAENEVALIAERQEIEGADLVLAIGGGVVQYVGGLEDATYRPRLATTSLGSLRAFIRDRSGRDFSVLEGATAGNTAEQTEWWGDPDIQECVSIVEAAGEPPILDPDTRRVEDPENLVSVAAACRDVRLFVAIATAAGPNLTNETFAAAGQALGEFHIPGMGDGFYDADNPDGGAPVYFYEWDPAIEDLTSDGTTL